MEVMVISIISPVLACDWTLSVWMQAFLTTIIIIIIVIIIIIIIVIVW